MLFVGLFPPIPVPSTGDGGLLRGGRGCHRQLGDWRCGWVSPDRQELRGGWRGCWWRGGGGWEVGKERVRRWGQGCELLGKPGSQGEGFILHPKQLQKGQHRRLPNILSLVELDEVG